MEMRSVCGYLPVIIIPIVLSFYFQEDSPPTSLRSVFDGLPLRTATKEIRLLTLLPAEREDRVECNLSVASLAKNPAYEALSYTWGDPNVTIPIWLNGQSFDITTNLHGAPVQLRDGSAPRTLWVDALCINQRDLSELGEQVQHMRLIYQKASEVLVWLGVAIEDSDLAMHLVAQLSKNDRYGLEDTEPSSPDNELARHSLNSLFNRPWWTRLWVIQEFAVAKADPLIDCGGKWIRSDCLYEFLNEVDTLFGYHRTRRIYERDFEAVRNLIAFRQTLSKGLPLGLVEVLSQTRRTSSATRIHDLVYALLGLVDADYGAGIAVDYLRPVEQLFTQTTAQCIVVNGNLDVLYGAHARGSLNLPSWVPDWSVDRLLPISLNNHEGNQRASGEIKTSAQFSQDGRILMVDGVKIDTILQADQEQFDSNVHRGASRIEEFVSKLAEMMHFANKRHANLGEVMPSEGVFAELANTFCYSKSFVPVMEDYEERIQEFVLEHLHALLHFSRRSYRSEKGLRQEFDMAVWYTVYGRHLFVTQNGLLGIATGSAEAGDILAVLFGGSMPFILRKIEHSEKRYKLVGYAIVHGMREGQGIKAMNELSPTVTRARFSII